MMDFSKPKVSYGVVAWQSWQKGKKGYKIEGKLHIMDFDAQAHRSSTNRHTLCGKPFRPEVIAGATLRSDSVALLAVVIMQPEMCQTCRRSLESGGAGWTVVA